MDDPLRKCSESEIVVHSSSKVLGLWGTPIAWTVWVDECSSIDQRPGRDELSSPPEVAVVKQVLDPPAPGLIFSHTVEWELESCWVQAAEEMDRLDVWRRLRRPDDLHWQYSLLLLPL